MGILFSRWRKRESSKEILESLEKDISALQNSRERNEQLRKKYIGSLILYSIILYISCAIVFYFWYFPTKWTDRVMKSLPLLVFPFLILGVKKFLHYIFVSRISKNEEKLAELKERKKEVLEDVMENETYKVAKELLDRFDPNRDIIKVEGASESAATTPPSSPPPTAKGTKGTELRLRQKPVHKLPPDSPGPLQRASSLPSVAAPPSPPASPRLPRSIAQSPLVENNLKRGGKSVSMTNLGTPPPGVLAFQNSPKPIPVPPRERSVMDKVVEYMIGDGPNNRFALICKQCLSHNGMALREDFEYTAFRCCYCYTLNQARKERPKAPSLEQEYQIARTMSGRTRLDGKFRRPANSVQSVLASRQLQQQSSADESTQDNADSESRETEVSPPELEEDSS